MSDAARELLKQIVQRYSGRTCEPLRDATSSADGANLTCGDHVQLDLRTQDGAIVAASYSARACVVCVASCAILVESVAHHTIAEARALALHVHALVAGRAETDQPPLALFSQIRLLPSRVHCAELPWEILERALPR